MSPAGTSLTAPDGLTSAVTRRGRGSTPPFATVAATSAIWSGVTSTSPCPYAALASSTSSAKPPGSGPPPFVSCELAVGRSNGMGAPKPRRRAAASIAAPPVRSPASAYQMLHETSVARAKSRTSDPVKRWCPSTIRKPSTRRPVVSSPGCWGNAVAALIAPDEKPAIAVTILNAEPGT